MRAARRPWLRSRRTCASSARPTPYRSVRAPMACGWSVQLDRDRLALRMDPEEEELERLLRARIAPGVYLPRRHIRYRPRSQRLLRLAVRVEHPIALEHVYDLVTCVVVPTVRPARCGLQPRDDQLVLVHSRQVSAEKHGLGERRRGCDEALARGADADADQQRSDEHPRAGRSISEMHETFLRVAVRIADHRCESIPAR